MRYSSLNSADRTLITEISQYWLASGGDCAGFVFCQEAIKERIEELAAEEKSKDQE